MSTNFFLKGHEGNLTIERLLAFENKCGKLPKSYGQFLLIENGGVAYLKEDDSESLLFYNLDKEPNSLIDKWPSLEGAPPPKFIDIAEFQSLKKLQLNLSNGEIYQSGKFASKNIVTYLNTYVKEVYYNHELERIIENGLNDELCEYLSSKQIPYNFKLKEGKTLAQYAVLAMNDEALQILAKGGYDFSGVVHLIDKLGFWNIPLINAVKESNFDLNEKNEKGVSIRDLKSPWITNLLE